MRNNQKHWQSIYRAKQSNDLSWTVQYPKTSLDFIHSFNVSKTANIIDIGAGDSRLIDFLVAEEFENITLLDISSKALDKVKKRLGDKADKVKWIIKDITKYNPDILYDIWHDRATFHFLTTSMQIKKYVDAARKSVRGYLVIGTFSDKGPDKCSGLDIRQYNEQGLQKELSGDFKKIRCITEDHITPFNTAQNFLFCSFKRSLNR